MTTIGTNKAITWKPLKLNDTQEVCITDWHMDNDIEVCTNLTLGVNTCPANKGYVDVVMGIHREDTNGMTIVDTYGRVTVEFKHLMQHGIKRIATMSNLELKQLGSDVQPRHNIRLARLANQYL